MSPRATARSARNHYRTFDADRVVRVARKVLPPSRLSIN